MAKNRCVSAFLRLCLMCFAESVINKNHDFPNTEAGWSRYSHHSWYIFLFGFPLRKLTNVQHKLRRNCQSAKIKVCRNFWFVVSTRDVSSSIHPSSHPVEPFSVRLITHCPQMPYASCKCRFGVIFKRWRKWIKAIRPVISSR